MSYSIRSLLELPFVVQDRILEHLGRVDLVSMSVTCRDLHRPALKYLYRELTNYDWDHQALVESNLRRDPSLTRYIRSFTSYDPSFLKWLWIRASSSLKLLDLQWNYIDSKADVYSDFMQSIYRPNRVGQIGCSINSRLQPSFLTRLDAFDSLWCLTINNSNPPYTLQAIFEQLCVSSLVILDVDNVPDWRIRWRESFKERLPNLQLLVLNRYDNDDVMWDNVQDEEMEGRRPPSDIMWHSFRTLHQQSILFDDWYNSPFLDLAPSYAASHQLDPVPLIHWHVMSREYSEYAKGNHAFPITVGVIPLKDLTIILRAISSVGVDLSRMQLSLHLPLDTTPSISNLFPSELTDLSIHLPSFGNLDPSVVPACLRSLPRLKSLHVFLRISRYGYTPLGACTYATHSFRSLRNDRSAGVADAVKLTIARSSDPVWETVDFYGKPERLDTEGLKLDIENADFTMEAMKWFDLGRRLELVEMTFNYTTGEFHFPFADE